MKLKNVYANGFYAKNFPVQEFGVFAMRNKTGTIVTNIPWNVCDRFVPTTQDAAYNLISWRWTIQSNFEYKPGVKDFALNILHHVLDILDRSFGYDVGDRGEVAFTYGRTYKFASDYCHEFAEQFFLGTGDVLMISWERLLDFVGGRLEQE